MPVIENGTVKCEECGRGKIVFQAKGSVTVRSNETGKMFRLPESSLIDNA